MARVGRRLKWTLKKALKLAEDLIIWLQADPKNVFYEKFLVLERRLYNDIISNLCDKYPEFKRTIQAAKEIQRIKLMDGANTKVTSERIAQFLLQCEYGYVPMSKVENMVTGNNNVNITFEEVNNEEQHKD
jgi:hypothetical protein